MGVIKQKCVECGKFFEIEDKEQKWYAEKGFTLPRRCKSCRERRRSEHRKEDVSRG